MGRTQIFSCLSVVLCPALKSHHVRPGTAATAEAMTVPQRRLAGLWPWLLMAALQVVLGQPGLESERPALRAVIKVTLLKNEPTGKPITLEGVFVGGSAGYAEGKLMQVRLHKTVHAVAQPGPPILCYHSLRIHLKKNCKGGVMSDFGGHGLRGASGHLLSELFSCFTSQKFLQAPLWSE